MTRAVSEDQATHLGRRAVLLHCWRQGAGVGGGVGGGRLHIVVAEAAEEGAENAPAPLLLQAAVRLGRWRETRTEVEVVVWREGGVDGGEGQRVKE